MENLKKNLVELCSKNSNRIIENIICFRLERILKDEIKKLDIETYNEIELSILKQKIDNYFFLKAHEEILNTFNENKIRVVSIKGLFLADELYEDINIRRFGDIDLIIDRENIKKAFELLGKKGWYLCDTKEQLNYDTLSTKDINTVISRMCHINEIAKDYSLNNLYKTVCVDLHIRIYNDFDFESLYMKKIINRSIKKSSLGLEVYELELHDKLLHLLCSFTKEHIDTLAKSNLLGNTCKHVVRVNLLYDIALLINKYANKIAWNILLQRAREIEKEGELLFAVKIFDFIFPDIILEKFKVNLQINFEKYYTTNLTDGFKRRCLPYLINIDPEEFLTKPLYNIYTNLLKKLEWIGPEIKIYPEGDNKYIKECIIDEKNNKIENYFNTYYKFNSKNSDMINEEIKFYLQYNTKGLVINIDKKYNSKFNNEVFWITVGGINEQNSGFPPITLKRFEFKILENNNIECLDGLPSGGTIYNIRTKINNEFEVLDFNKSNIDYKIKFVIPWSMIKIDYKTCDELWFDFENKVNGTNLVCWANPLRIMFDDPTLLCKIKLINKKNI
ncbi:MAG: nucleotidyltransferase family protein [Clostridium sp.]